MATASGLEGVLVAETELSDVDGERGRLVLAGHDVESLAGKTPFERMCAMLWREDEAGVRARLGEARARAFAEIRRVDGALAAANGMDALRGSLGQLASQGDAADVATLTGAIAVYAAAWARRRAGQKPLAPDASASHASDYLRMARVAPGAPPAELSREMDTYLVTVSDHGLNASTFTARVVASTAADVVSAIVAAVGALKGPLHGGAPGPVLDMLDAIGAPERARAWIEAELGAGRRIMGMGHRIYRVRDPRAAVFEAAVERLEKAGVTSGRLALARSVEREAEAVLKERHPDRPLRANVEFFTAVLLEALGLPREAFSPTFAVGRVAGWCAHVLEQRRVGKLIRPASRYVGPAPVAS
jgi:citrate synthase